MKHTKTIAEILAARKSLHGLTPWMQAALSSREISQKMRETINRGGQPSSSVPRLPIIDSTVAAAAIIEAAGMKEATTEADEHAVALWIETNLAGMDCVMTGRVFLPFESIAKIEADAPQFITHTIAERKQAEAEAAGRKLIAAAARLGKTPAELLSDFDARNLATGESDC